MPERVIITGASSGIGKATALRFASEGWDVCLIARRAALLEEIVQSLPKGNHLVCPGSYDDRAHGGERTGDDLFFLGRG